VFARSSHHPQPLTEQGRPLRVQPSNPGLVLFSLCPSPSTLSLSLSLSLSSDLTPRTHATRNFYTLSIHKYTRKTTSQ